MASVFVFDRSSRRYRKVADIRKIKYTKGNGVKPSNFSIKLNPARPEAEVNDRIQSREEI